MGTDRSTRRNPKVLLISDMFPPRSGGSGRWLWELYRRLDGVAVHVIAGATPAAAAFDRTATMPIERVPLSFKSWGIWSIRGLLDYARATRAVARIAGRTRPDVIHCGKCLPEGLIGSF